MKKKDSFNGSAADDSLNILDRSGAVVGPIDAEKLKAAAKDLLAFIQAPTPLELKVRAAREKIKAEGIITAATKPLDTDTDAPAKAVFAPRKKGPKP